MMRKKYSLKTNKKANYHTDNTVEIGQNTIIQNNCIIEENVKIFPNCFIGNNVKIKKIQSFILMYLFITTLLLVKIVLFTQEQLLVLMDLVL